MKWCNVDIICCNVWPSATGKDNKEFNFRHDWNSLISDDPTLRMTRYTEKYFPDADTIVSCPKKIYTVDLKIFDVKIFSWFAQTTQIENMKSILQRIIIIARTFLFAQFHSTAT